MTWTRDDDQTLVPFSEEKYPKPKVAYTVKLKIAPNNSEGPFSGWVKLKLNRNAGVQNINVVGSRSGPISILGRHYQAALTLVDLERFKSAEGKELRLSLFVKSFGEELQIKEVISKSKLLTATLKKRPNSEATREGYDLYIKAIAGAPPGTTFTPEEPDELTLKTNHPIVPELKLKAQCAV